MNRISETDLISVKSHISSIINEGFLKNSKIFITGATGFFGKWLLESMLYLNKELKLDLKIWALSRNPEQFLKGFPFFGQQKCLNWITGDIRTFEFTIPQVEYIIHAATDADAKLNSEDPLLMLNTITEGTKRILEFARMQSKLNGFLLTSSGAVYGKQPEKISHTKEEDSFFIDINHHSSAYAEGKRLAELYCSIYARQYYIPVKIARCFAFVGPYLPLDKHFAIGNFISNTLNDEDLVIKGDGTPLRSYMYASDLVIWLLTILLKGEVNSPYNVGSNEAISISDLAFLVNGFQSGKREVKILGKKSKASIEKYIPDITKSIDDLNLKITVSLEEAITKTIQFQ